MVQSNHSKVSAGKISNPILVSCRESIMETKQSFYGKFYIGPLSVGQGLTLANALRRTLLSELVGLAITSVSIEGVTHEYSTLKGVRESVLDILLNLKQIVLKSKQSLKRPQIAYLYCQGPGVIRAADLILPPTIQCVDPEQYIATLSSDGFLKMKLFIRQGKNYLVQTPKYVSKREPSSTVRTNGTLKAKTLIPFFKYKVCLTVNKQKKDDKTKGRSLDSKSFFSFNSRLKEPATNRNFSLTRPPNRSDLEPVREPAERENFQKKDVVLSFSHCWHFPQSLLQARLGLGLTENHSQTILQNPPDLHSQTKKKLNTFVLKNYRSLNNLFENSKNKELFLHLFKKQIVSLLALKMNGMTVIDQNYSDGVSGHLTLPLPQKNRSTFWLEGDPFSSMFFNPTTKTKPLFIDAVFMPVTKVNYLLEESRQKLFDSYDFESLQEFRTNNPKEKSAFNLADEVAAKETSSAGNFKEKQKRRNEIGSKDAGLEASGSHKSSFFQEKKGSNFSGSIIQSEMEHSISEKTQTKTQLAMYFKKNWLNSKESWVLFSSEFNKSLFEQFNQFPKDIIILEIWTNGSILPRTALKQAAQNLSNLFVKFENAKIMGNTFVETKTNYRQTIQQLYERYKKL